MRVDLHRAITSLTRALDFVGVDEINHGKRVGLMAAAIAAELGWDASAQGEMLYAGMIQDCGVSREREHRLLDEMLEWPGAEEHCLRGEQFLLACPPLAHFAPIVRWHHTRWETLCAPPLVDTIGEADRFRANLIFLADRADVLMTPYCAGQSLKNDILWEFPQLVERLAGLGGSLFSPELVAAFRRAAGRESFWLAMDPEYIEDEVEAGLAASPAAQLGAADALSVAGLFAQMVDAKSSYTLDHSTRVARIARHLATAAGIAGEELDLIEIAALLHDVGKLRVPEAIIDKPGALTAEERAFVMRHSYDTGHILRKAFPGLPIAGWAAMHHENLLGTGYPFHQAGATIPQQARLIAVADIFQAFAQQRPYRPRLGATEVMAQIDAQLAQGRVDREVVELLRTELEACYGLAVE